MLTQDDPDVVHREYLEFGLHLYPNEMKQKILEKIEALEGKVDAIFLGYGTCQSLSGLPKMVNTPTVMLECDDCIAALLTPQGYEKEKKKCTGTWFSSPGWAEKGMDGIIKELHLDVLEGYDPMIFAKMIFDGYSRALFIDTGVGERDRFEAMSKDFAKRLGLQHECTDCSLAIISDSIAKAKILASRQENSLSVDSNR